MVYIMLLLQGNLGVKAVVAKSIERIHAANLVNFGIVPLYFKNVEDYEKIAQGDRIELSDIRTCLKNNDPVFLVNKTSNQRIELMYNLSERQKNILYAGGLLSYTVKEEN